MVFFAGAGKDQYGVDVSMDQTDSRTMNHEKVSRRRQEVKFKLHPSNEIANLFQDNSLVRSTPLTLEAGFEYFLDVTPHVVATTDAFKEMDTKQRKCKLQNEIYEKSIFRVYKMENCKYECKVKQAESICKCIPWDFMHNIQAVSSQEECDLFGRTCFYNAIENLTKSYHDFCNHCIKECDVESYDVKMTRKESLLKMDWGQDTRFFEFGTLGEKNACFKIGTGPKTDQITNFLKLLTEPYPTT